MCPWPKDSCLKFLGKILLIFLPVSLSPATRPFLAVEPCDPAHDEKTYHYARVLWSEARGESLEGKLAIISALKNGAHGYKVGKLRPDLVELAAGEMKKPVRHPYRFWINFDRATDIRQIRLAKKAMRDKRGITLGSHFFF